MSRAKEDEVTLEEVLAAHVSALSLTVMNSAAVLSAMVDRICECFQAGGKLLVCGNGGSAADAQHIAGEFVDQADDAAATPSRARTLHRLLGSDVYRQ